MLKRKTAAVLLAQAFALLVTAAGSSAQEASVSAVLEADRTSVFLHETLNLTLTVTSVGIWQGKTPELIGLPGSAKLRFSDQQELPPEQRTVNRQPHDTRRFTVEVCAMSVGAIELAPTARVGIMTRSRSFFMDVEETPYDVPVKPLTITVNPLPETGKPRPFSGAVGEFTFDVEVGPLDVAPGELITAVMKIRGSGYLEGIIPPAISPGANFRVYDPRAVSGGDASEKVFEQILIPQNTNAVFVGGVAFSYFDPKAGAYKTISKGPFSLKFHAPKKPRDEPGFRRAETRSSRGGRPARHGQDRRLAAAGWAAAALAALIAMLGAVYLRIVRLTQQKKRGEEPRPAARTAFSRIMLALAAVLLVSGYFLMRIAFYSEPEAVVILNEKARFAPAFTALPVFDLPAGSVVSVVERYGDWVKISVGDRRAWVPASSLGRQSGN